jgi:hypothetical protein
MLPTFRPWLIGLLMLTLVAGASAACGDDAETNSSASQAAIDELSARVQRNEMMYAVLTLGTLELHDMDVGLNETGEVEPSYVPNTRTAVRLLALTNWDASVKGDADALHEHAVSLLKALRENDVDTAKTEATALHEGVHQFMDGVWAIVAAGLPADAGGVDEHADDADETPDQGEPGTPEH